MKRLAFAPVWSAVLSGSIAGCVLLLACGGDTSSTDERTDGGLRRAEVESAIDRGIAALASMADSGLRLDEIYNIDRFLTLYPDGDLRELVDAARGAHVADPSYRLIDRSAPRPRLPEDPGSGLEKLETFILAAIGQPEDRARSYIEDYLSMNLDGYAQTHQALAIIWGREQSTIGPGDYDAYLRSLVDQIERKVNSSEQFTDLYAEQVSILIWADPDRNVDERWISRILAVQEDDGGWTTPGVPSVAFDGAELPFTVHRAHTTTFALNALVGFYVQHWGDGERAIGDRPTSVPIQ